MKRSQSPKESDTNVPTNDELAFWEARCAQRAQGNALI